MEKEIKIALFSPASIPSLQAYRRGINVLKKYKISFKSFVDFSESSPSMKAFLLYELVTQKEYDFIWAVRGGFGSIRLIPYLEDFFLENKKNKIFPYLIGFSDITVLHIYFYKKFKKRGIHAPMIVNLPFLSKDALNNLLQIIFERKDIYLKGKGYQEGKAEGILLGGNLVTLASLCGTPYFPLEELYILFIEDTKEKTYKLERAFLQIIFSLGLNKIKGVAIGDLGKEDPVKFLKILSSFLPEKIPIGYDFKVGHIKDSFSLIIGEKTQLIVKNGKATLFQKNFLI